MSLERIISKNIFSYKFMICAIWIICLAEVYVLINNIQSKSYEYLYLLPISYTIAMTIFLPVIEKSCIYKKGVIYYLIQFVLAYRYLMLPLACMYTDLYGGWTAQGSMGFGVEPQIDSMSKAIFWMCTEIFAAQFAIFIGVRVITNMERKRLKNFIRKDIKYSFLSNKIIIIIFCLCSFILLIVFQPQLFSQFGILDDNFSVGDNSPSGSFFKVIFFTFKFSCLLIIYSYCAKKYKKNKNIIWLIISIVFLGVFLGISIGVSRWSILLPTIASIVVLKKIFNISKKIIVFIGIITFVLILNITFFKFGYLLDYKFDVINLLLIVFQQSNEYISGPRSIAQGLEMLNIFGDRIQISTIFNSFFSGFAGLASLTNDMDKLQSFFNYYAIGINFEDRPLICPILIEGIAFFPVYPWLFMSIFYISACILDYKSSISNKYENIFIMTYLGLWFALCLNINTKIEISQISQIIPSVLLLFINKKISWKNEKKI